MISTRPAPPWLPIGYSTQTYLEKSIVVRYAFTNTLPDSIIDVNYVRESLYTVPSTVWER